MKQHGLLKKISLLTASALLCAGMTLGAAAAETSGYDMDYYSQLRDKDVTINVYNWGEYIANGDDDSLDINALTPMEALNTLYDLHMRAKLR